MVIFRFKLSTSFNNSGYVVASFVLLPFADARNGSHGVTSIWCCRIASAITHPYLSTPPVIFYSRGIVVRTVKGDIDNTLLQFVLSSSQCLPKLRGQSPFVAVYLHFSVLPVFMGLDTLHAERFTSSTTTTPSPLFLP